LVSPDLTGLTGITGEITGATGEITPMVILTPVSISKPKKNK